MRIVSKWLCCAACIAVSERWACADPGPRSTGSPTDPPCACLAGDLNGDCAVDGADLGVLLGGWGSSKAPGDLTGDGVVDGADLGAMLSNWGPCPLASTCDGYSSMKYAGEFVGGPDSIIPVVVLSGTVDVLDSGEPQGSIAVVFGDGSSVTIDIALATTTVYIDESVVALPSGGPAYLASINGVATSISAMLAQFETDLLSGATPKNWAVASRASLVLAALAETEVFCCDLNMALQDATSASSAFWCKVGLVSLSACIVAEATGGCEALTSGCDAESHRMIGHFPMPCELLEAMCIDGEFGGPQAAFDGVLGMWLGQ